MVLKACRCFLVCYAEKEGSISTVSLRDFRVEGATRVVKMEHKTCLAKGRKRRGRMDFPLQESPFAEQTDTCSSLHVGCLLRGVPPQSKMALALSTNPEIRTSIALLFRSIFCSYGDESSPLVPGALFRYDPCNSISSYALVANLYLHCGLALIPVLLAKGIYSIIDHIEGYVVICGLATDCRGSSSSGWGLWCNVRRRPAGGKGRVLPPLTPLCRAWVHLAPRILRSGIPTGDFLCRTCPRRLC